MDISFLYWTLIHTHGQWNILKFDSRLECYEKLALVHVGYLFWTCSFNRKHCDIHLLSLLYDRLPFMLPHFVEWSYRPYFNFCKMVLFMGLPPTYSSLVFRCIRSSILVLSKWLDHSYPGHLRRYKHGRWIKMGI